MTDRDYRAEWEQLQSFEREIVADAMGDAVGLYEIIGVLKSGGLTERVQLSRAQEAVEKLLRDGWIDVARRRDMRSQN